MAIKLADTVAPMGDFPAVMADDVDFSDGESLQYKFDNGKLGMTTRSLPPASAAELGNVYQYMGATTSDYTRGYFYECVQDASGNYVWQVVTVSPVQNAISDDEKKYLDNIIYGYEPTPGYVLQNYVGGDYSMFNTIKNDISNGKIVYANWNNNGEVVQLKVKSDGSLYFEKDGKTYTFTSNGYDIFDPEDNIANDGEFATQADVNAAYADIFANLGW